jgi:hypothetical protein
MTLNLNFKGNCHVTQALLLMTVLASPEDEVAQKTE